MTGQNSYMELSDLQDLIKERIGYVEQWVRVEIESHRVVAGHHYLNVLEKGPDGSIAAKASARIWRSNSFVVTRFKELTGKDLETGLSVVVRVTVDYHPQFGLALTITDIDPNYTIGRRELEKQANIRKLEETGLMEKQKSLTLPFLPSRIAVISSSGAAGYGDFVKHLQTNPRGFTFDCTLFQALMQGENAPSSIVSALETAGASGQYDLILILRGGGADSDLFCYDDLSLCTAIALCPVPVMTAIGHERDYHIADMVSHEHFKTPTALADALVEWTEGVEDMVMETVASIRYSLLDRVNALSNETTRAVSNISFALSSVISEFENRLALLVASITAADPRAILSQGYVLAQSEDGTILRTAGSKSPGDRFSLRFNDGTWACGINEVRLNK